MRVLIAGGGIAGLAAGGLLAQSGAHVQLFERSEQLREVGAGIQLSANAGHVLDALGIADQLAEIGIVPGAWRMRLFDSGELVAELKLGDRHRQMHGKAYLLVHRAALQNLLIERLESLQPDAINLGAEVAGFESSDNRVRLFLADGSVTTGDVLIAADGVKSRLRETIAGPDKPVYSGSSAWRVLLPAARLPSGFCASGPNVFMGERRHMVQYRVRDADGTVYLNYVAPVEQPAPQEESWTTRRDWGSLKRDFAGWHDDVQRVIDETDRNACYLWTLNIRQPLETWVSDRAVVIGDAAHPTLPYLAQGAAMALEDAAVLCRSLAAAHDISDGLRLFQANRTARANRVVEAANRIAGTFHGAGSRDLRADLISGASSLEARDTWLYNYNPMTAPLAPTPQLTP